MTYRDLCRLLSENGIDCAEHEAALLAEHFCGLSRAALMTDPNRELDGEALPSAIRRRCEREPLAYILGEWGFFGETYTVSPACLIPRPETELLVERAIGKLKKNARFADLCTGSGCIAISTLCHRPDCTAVAVDLFPETAKLAKHNARRNGVDDRLSIRVADVLSPDCLGDEPPFDAVFSNPPYIRSDVVGTLEPELFREPRAALDGGDDGLIFYRTIIRNFAPRLNADGFMLFEIGYDQEEAIQAIAAENGFGCTVERDLSGNPRLAVLVH